MRSNFSILLLLAVIAVPTVARAEPLVLLVHPPANQSELSAEAMLALLRGERRNWSGGIDARIALPSRQSEHYESVARKVFNASGQSMERQWFRLVFSGRVNAPTYLATDEAVAEFVTSHSGAVGVASESILDLVGDSIAVIRLP